MHLLLNNYLYGGEDRCVYRVLVGEPEGKRPLGNLRRRLEDNILRWIFRKWVVGMWTESSWLRIMTGGGLL
jgi:hypothetical protein